MVNESRISCLHPINVVNPKYRSSKSTFDAKDAKAREDYKLLVPCGHCILCRKRRASQWHFRLYHEAIHTPQFSIGSRKYLNIWFCTFTFKDEYLPNKNSDTLRSDIAPFIRAWRDNWRKRFGVSPRYFCVTDVGGERGRLHLHLLIFNPTYKDGRRISVSECFKLHETQPSLQLEWRYGFVTYCSLLRGIEAIHYISGYVNNQNALKTQRKHGKPMCADSISHMPVTMCSNGIGKQFITTEEFERLKKCKSAITRLGQFVYAVPRYYRIKYFDNIALPNGAFITPQEQLSALNSRYVHKLRDSLIIGAPVVMRYGNKRFYTLEQFERFVLSNDKLFGYKTYEYKPMTFTYINPARSLQLDMFNPLIL